MLLILLSVAISLNGTITSFLSQTNPFNITFVGGDNQTFFLEIPLYGLVKNISLSLTPFNISTFTMFENMSLWLTLNETTGLIAEDQSLNKLNFTLSVGVDLQQTSARDFLNYSMGVAGDDISITPVPLPLQFGNDTVSIMFWMNASQWSATQSVMAGYDIPSTSGWYIMRGGNTALDFTTVRGPESSTTLHTFCSAASPINDWIQIAITRYYNGTVHIWQDNQTCETNSTNAMVNATPNGAGQKFNMGNRALQAGRFFFGKLDQIVFFTRELNATDIEWHYSNSQPIIFPFNRSISNVSINLDGSSLLSVANEFPATNISFNIIPFNNILRDGCTCTNCSIDSNICNIPITFNSATAGILQVNLSNASYEYGLDNCSDFTYPVINLTYKNAIDKNVISVDNAYDLNVIDPFTQTLQNTFNGDEKNSFCSPVNYTSFNHSLTGAFTLSKTGYGTQIYEYTAANLLIGSYPTSLYDLYLAELANTSTIVFTWRTNAFENVDGLMQIYECLGDGTKNLIGVSSIINGEANANLELLTVPYSYEVVFDGVTYTDDESFTKCHIETQTTRLYILKVGESIAPITGIYSIPCNITRTGNFSFLMQWGLNPQSDSQIQGCVNAYRQTVRGDTEVYEECSNGTGISATVADSGFTYIVTGRLFQNGYSIGCQNQLTFETSADQVNTFGITGILSIFFLIAGMILLFVNEAPKWYPVMGVVGMVLAWMLGILAFGWVGISSLVFFVVIIILIGRHGRKR